MRNEILRYPKRFTDRSAAEVAAPIVRALMNGPLKAVPVREKRTKPRMSHGGARFKAREVRL